MASASKFRPNDLKPSQSVDALQQTLKPSLVLDSYTTGDPDSSTLKPSLLKADGTLKSSLLTSAGDLKPALLAYDVDVLAHFDAVETAGGSFDLSSISAKYTEAYCKSARDVFVRHLKSFGIWSKCSLITTQVGADFGAITVPIKGSTLTNTGFVSGDLVSASSNLVPEPSKATEFNDFILGTVTATDFVFDDNKGNANAASRIQVTSLSSGSFVLRQNAASMGTDGIHGFEGSIWIYVNDWASASFIQINSDSNEYGRIEPADGTGVWLEIKGSYVPASSRDFLDIEGDGLVDFYFFDASVRPLPGLTDGTGKSLNTNIVPDTEYDIVNGISFGTYLVTNDSSTNGQIMGSYNGPTRQARITTGTSQGVFGSEFTSSSGVGLFGFNYKLLDQRLFKNGVLVDTGTRVDSMPDKEFYLFQINALTGDTTSTQAYQWIGEVLTAEEHQAMYDAVATFLAKF